MLVYVDHLRVPVIRQWFVLERVVGMLLLPAARIRLAIPVSPMVLLCDNVANGGPLAIGPLAGGEQMVVGLLRLRFAAGVCVLAAGLLMGRGRGRRCRSRFQRFRRARR